MARDRYKSEISEAVHSAVRDFFDVGLADQETMRKFDKSCLTAITPFSPEDISGLRAKEGVSQGVFAHYLNVRPKLVSEWERGTKTPSGPSLKLLSLVREKGLNAIR
jgi:putative transcriptional regulator